MDARPSKAVDRFARAMLELVDEHDQECAAAALERYRPQIAADVGEEITEQVLSDAGLWAFLREVSEHGLEAEEAAHSAAVHLRDHPEAAPAEAFTAVRDRAADDPCE